MIYLRLYWNKNEILDEVPAVRLEPCMTFFEYIMYCLPTILES